ncbi:MAG: hypothetical protein DRN07_00545 [Thermoplasmata archaeon]|nr:MAG: hypothetical protein DRN07_00545 [Thermoplasmata archaeon]
MRVLVTGASGFIGTHVVTELLANGYGVRALARHHKIDIEGVEVVRGDITKPESLLPAVDGVDAVIHNAAYAMDWGKRHLFYRVNVEGTRNVAEACRKIGVMRMVLTSSAGVYGFPNTTATITERSALRPLNAYGKSKLESERVLTAYRDITASVVRPPLVLGAGSRAAGILLSKIEQGNMTYVGEGTQHISIAHPADVARCLRLVLERDERGEVYNVVSFVCTIRELFEEAAAQLGVEKPKRHVPYRVAYAMALLSETFFRNPPLTRFRIVSMGTTRTISAEKASRELGYAPRFDLQKTVEDMVMWYRKKDILAHEGTPM